ncbi:hypothetical protein [Enterococcus columbae]|uniref:ATP-binding protein n=1 Tax=Enterococcus columbae DSM 7374 = ATCC 51263 TaxID=1121865 RepID=S1MV04_9ENTE|nr:hypothetical protein [Enterococcus columbae]EOT41813.1 hypothetical protein OMW_01226 [Enterococcus columbae DSM 7374 = ATCC 51263]EOW80667.1 hypothetical protein I568_01845 [Enterococcus columbae DSM 7374 = ATCC 51263]OJG21915.1 hypothetical protein RR47_GL001119 [Enterococcus columbae DSM 7374 = ATCC 51263]
MDALTHKCPNCAGPLTFEPNDQKFHCPYCLSIFTEQEVSEFEQAQNSAQLKEETEPSNFEQTKTTESEEAGFDLYYCPSCGAQIATDATTAATECYFCQNPVILNGRISGAFLPEKILPFKIDKKTAQAKFLAWAKSKKFVPKAFFNQQQVEKIKGVYFPYWLAKGRGQAEVKATGTTLSVWQVGDIEYTETKQYQIHRKGHFIYRNLIENALSKNTQQTMVEGVQPFPIDEAIDFHSQYLSGFFAEKRDIEFETIANQVKNEMVNYAISDLEETIAPMATMTNEEKSGFVDEITNQYVLLPLWLVTYRSNIQKNKVFYYAMNGVTGKVQGILPLDYKKLGLTSFALGILLSLLCMLGGYFFL